MIIELEWQRGPRCPECGMNQSEEPTADELPKRMVCENCRAEFTACLRDQAGKPVQRKFEGEYWWPESRFRLRRRDANNPR